MSRQQIKIAHAVLVGAPYYRVISVKNSVDFSPGQELPKNEVEGLCRSARWDVTIVGLNTDGEKK